MRSDEQPAHRARPRGRSLLAGGLQRLDPVGPATAARDHRESIAMSASAIAAIASAQGSPVGRRRASSTSRRSVGGSGDGDWGQPIDAAPAPSAARGLERGRLEHGTEHRSSVAAAAAVIRGNPIAASPLEAQVIGGPSRSHHTDDNAPPVPLGSRDRHPIALTTTPVSAQKSPSDITLTLTANPSPRRDEHFKKRPFLDGEATPPLNGRRSTNLAHLSPIEASNPIPIPIPQRSRLSPSTPLTGRYHSDFEKGSHFPFEDHPPRTPSPSHRTIARGPASPAFSTTSSGSRISSDAGVFGTKSLLDLSQAIKAERNAPGLNTARARTLSGDTTPHVASVRIYSPPPQATNGNDRSSHAWTPSNLAPHRPSAQSNNTNTMSASRKTANNLQLTALPRFHPAVYQSPNSSAVTSPVPSRLHHSGRPASATPQMSSQRSGPQRQLQQYQRDLLASVTRSAAMSTPSTPPPARDTPKAPALHPCGSPGPATPLALEEGKTDYLTAGVGLGEGASRDFVDKLIRGEHERRSGMSSGHSSPAVSPAGGRA